MIFSRIDGMLTDPDVPGRWSTARLGRVVGIVGLSVGFGKVVWTAPPSDALAWLFAVYGGILVVPELIQKFMGLRWGGNGNGGPNGAPPRPT